MEQMLRIYFMQNWFTCRTRRPKDSLYDIESMRRFAASSYLDMTFPTSRRSCASVICWSCSN